MRRVALALFSTVAGLVALLSFKTHTTPAPTPVAAAAPADPGTPTPSTDPTTTPTAAPEASTAPSAAPKASAKTVTGDSIDTQWGPVQVQITVSGGKITAATAVVYPQNNPRDQEINAVAIPTLEQESIGVSTADIDMVSGATYTSQGYLQSLQSALDKAGL